MSFRIEKDTMGNVEVPADKYWGAQTERSRNNFKIGAPASMPLDIVYGFAYLKKAAAYAKLFDFDLGKILWVSETSSSYSPPIFGLAKASAEDAAAPPTEIDLGEQDVSVTVDVRWAIK